jgi:hypothetical protein
MLALERIRFNRASRGDMSHGINEIVPSVHCRALGLYGLHRHALGKLAAFLAEGSARSRYSLFRSVRIDLPTP